MRVAVSGSTGLVGSEVVTVLSAAGHEVVRLVRRAPAPGERAVRWDPEKGEVDAAGLEGLDAVVHLAGENIGVRPVDRRPEGRHPRQPRERDAPSLRGPRGARPAAEDARVRLRDRLSTETGERMRSPRRVLPARDFFAEVCREWEAASAPAARKGIRVVALRIGMVLSPKGGALARMLPLFRAGLGGVIGGGRQYVSWVALDDLPLIILHALQCGDLSGPVNAVAPRPVTNREFTEALGKALSRPTPLPVPAFALRLAVGGEMADALLLASARVIPRRLEETGYRFRFPELSAALRHLLGKGGTP